MSQAAAIPANFKVQAPPVELEREVLIKNQRDIGWLSDRVASVIEGKTPWWWWAMMVPSLILYACMGSMVCYQISVGVGVWGGRTAGTAKMATKTMAAIHSLRSKTFSPNSRKKKASVP